MIVIKVSLTSYLAVIEGLYSSPHKYRTKETLVLSSKSRSSLIRKKSAQNKVYIPANNRENQYLLVEFELSELIIAQLMTAKGIDQHALASFYLEFKQNFFNSCKANGINNAMFVAKDKLVRLRFGEESQVIETSEQLIVFYDPKRHQGFKACYDKEQLVSKLVLAVFAMGEDIREQAVLLHQKATQMVAELAQAVGQSADLFKVRDHQHITYELFAAEKGDKKTTTHGLRFVPNRYQQQSLILPDDTKHNGYVVANLPIPMHLIEQAESNISVEQPYQVLYKSIIRTLTDVADEQDVNKLAVMANGLQPIVRSNQNEQIQISDELVYLAFGEDEDQEYIADWNATNLVDSVSLVFKPTTTDVQQNSFGRYLSKLNQVLRLMAKVMGINPETEDVMVRFHQNTQYQFPTKN